jgi:hypothetical protein
MDKQMLSKTKLFEKIEIGWFSIEDMKKRRSEFRGFYQEIVDKFIADKENILTFIHKKNKKKNNTRKLKSSIKHSNVMDNDII